MNISITMFTVSVSEAATPSRFMGLKESDKEEEQSTLSWTNPLDNS